MNLHEYQAKGLFAEYGLPVSEGYAVDTADEAVAAAEKLGGEIPAARLLNPKSVLDVIILLLLGQ